MLMVCDVLGPAQLRFALNVVAPSKAFWLDREPCFKLFSFTSVCAVSSNRQNKAEGEVTRIADIHFFF